MSKKSKTYWAGFCDDRLHVSQACDDYSNEDFKYLEIFLSRKFLSRKEARKRYEDVRKVIITEVK